MTPAPLVRSLGKILAVLLLAWAAASSLPTASAFPPAPFFTLYGTVRDEQGQTLRIAGAVVVFYKDGVEKLRQTIAESTQSDQNYQIRLRMDMQRLGTQSYSDLSTGTGAAFTLAILINNIAYYPIEMSVTRSVGNPGERVRLDLTLGVDSDGDGLPDAWEQSQLFAAGFTAGPNGWDLSKLDRNGDFDGDGISNINEYLAGTFATDPTDYLSLRIREKSATSVHLQFLSISGKVYTLETSTDLKVWTPMPFYLRSPEPEQFTAEQGAPIAQPSLQAASTGVVDLYAATAADTTHAFYRLKVR